MRSIWIDRLRGYRLPDGILPLAPRRELFAPYSDDALAAAVELGFHLPEKRGTISRALQRMNFDCASPGHAGRVTIEAHLDGKDLPEAVVNQLLELGFEPDGFVLYNPAHFNAHLTLKFAVPPHAPRKRAQLLSYARRSCEIAHSLLSQMDVEAYLELEVYPASNRRFWNIPLCGHWRKDFPLRDRSFHITTPACDTLSDAATKLVKRADIHVKIAKTHESRRALINELCRCGFYRVVTWSSNDVCTAEFRDMRDAIRVFELLERFFNRCGGASEMTLECISGYWRTLYKANGRARLAAVPPLVVATNCISSGLGPHDSAQ